MKRFLITGLPRIRSAWLAALFSGPGVECYHDAIHHGGVDKMLEAITRSKAPYVGLIDPSAASVYPRDALAVFEKWPIVMVFRNEEDCRTGLANWVGSTLTNWGALVNNHEWFLGQVESRVYAVEYDSLDSHGVVAEIYRCCTGLVLDKHRFDLFNTLKIEQHYGKAARAASLLRH